MRGGLNGGEQSTDRYAAGTFATGCNRHAGLDRHALDELVCWLEGGNGRAGGPSGGVDSTTAGRFGARYARDAKATDRLEPPGGQVDPAACLRRSGHSAVGRFEDGDHVPNGHGR